MNVAAISLKLLMRGGFEKNVAFRAASDGVQMLFNDEDPVPVRDSKHLDETLVNLCELFRPNAFILTVQDVEGMCYINEQPMTLEDIFDVRKEEYELEHKWNALCDHDPPEWDWGASCAWKWFCLVKLDMPCDNLFKTVKIAQKKAAIAGEECPVLKVPLKLDCLMLRKCGHYISKEAWGKIVPGASNLKACPLCRAFHDWNDVEC